MTLQVLHRLQCYSTIRTTGCYECDHYLITQRKEGTPDNREERGLGRGAHARAIIAENKEGELRGGRGKTSLNPANENLSVQILQGLERGSRRGSQVAAPIGRQFPV